MLAFKLIFERLKLGEQIGDPALLLLTHNQGMGGDSASIDHWIHWTIRAFMKRKLIECIA